LFQLLCSVPADRHFRTPRVNELLFVEEPLEDQEFVAGHEQQAGGNAPGGQLQGGGDGGQQEGGGDAPGGDQQQGGGDAPGGDQQQGGGDAPGGDQQQGDGNAAGDALADAAESSDEEPVPNLAMHGGFCFC